MAHPSGVAEILGDPSACAEHVSATLDALVAAGALHPADVRHAAPAGDRWSTAEVAELILAPVAQVPQGRCWMVVVSDAASMTPDAAARLLRTIEEPPAPVWFVLCRDPDTALGVPVAGRVTHWVTLPTEPGDPRLVAALDAVDAADTFDQTVGTAVSAGTPMAEAERVTAPLREIAKRLKPRPAGPWLRRLVRSLLDQWATEAAEALRAHADNAAVLAALDRYAREDVGTRAALGLFVPPESALGPLIAARADLHAAIADATAART